MATTTVWNWMRFHPLRFSLVLFGLALLLFSMNVRGYGFASASLSESEFWMQPGSDVRAQVDVDIQSTELVPISFSIQQVEGITIDGALQGISTTGKFSRPIRINVSQDVPPGTYHLQLTLLASLNGQTYHYSFPITVHVSSRERVAYFTSSNSTLSPHIDQIQVTPAAITLQRGEVKYAHVSFRNLGNPTDYAIEFNPTPTGLFASVVTPNHNFVDAGETVQSDIEFRAFTSSPFETTPISIYARNRVTQEKMFLGRVNVTIVKTTNLLLSIPFRHIELEKGSSQQYFLTLQNTEPSDLDVVIQTSSPSVEVTNPQLHIPANSSISIPFTAKASTIGTQTETIYVLNSDYENVISFAITTIPATIVLGETEARTSQVAVVNDSGIEWNDLSFQIRNLPAGWKANIVPAHASLLQGETVTTTIHFTAPKDASATVLLLAYNHGQLVETIPVESTPNPDTFARVTGFVSGIGRPVIGVIVLIIAVLVVFSADFRKRVRSAMPKPKPIDRKLIKEVKQAPIETVGAAQAAKEATIPASASAETPSQ